MIKVRVSDYKGNFRFTIPVKELRKTNAKIGDYIKIILRKGNDRTEYYARVSPMPKSRTNLQLRRSIPKQLAEKMKIKQYDEVELQISLVNNVRSNRLITNDYYIDILAAIPEKTRSGKTIMVDLFEERGERWCKIWYSSGHGGKTKEIELKRFIKINKELGEFFGLMQAEGGKKNRFTFTNKFISEHLIIMGVAKSFGISEGSWNYLLYHKKGMNKKDIKLGLINFCELLNINKTISVIENKNLKDFAYTSYLNGVLFGETMLGILIKMRCLLSNISHNKISEPLKEFATGFILKVLIGDGTVVPIRCNTGLEIIISEQDRIAQEDIINILNIFNIKAKARDIKIRVSTNPESCLWLLKNKAFVGHKENRRKLITYILNNYYFDCLYNRLNGLNECSIQKFSELNKLSYNTAEMYLYRNYKRGYFYRTQNKNISIYIITNKGKEFIESIRQAKIELTTPSCTPQERDVQQDFLSLTHD